MKVLLTGASGFIGQQVLASLRRSGIDVVTVGRTCPHDLVSASFIQADLLDESSLVPLFDRIFPTHLIHLAWVTEYGAYRTSPMNLQWTHASSQLVQAFCKAGGRHVVVAGTCFEYDGSHGYCRELTTPLEPATLYGIAKDATRRLVAAVCAQHKVSCAWGRVFLLHGKGEDSRRFVPSLLDAFSGARSPFAVNLPAWRDFLHVSDVAEGLVTLLRSGANGVYNVSSGEPVQLRQLVRTLAGLIDVDPAPILDIESPRGRDEPALFVGESLRLRALGWQPRHSLAEGLALTVASRHGQPPPSSI
ncbi:MAG: NAD(P)-dependent oxidoreductase [Pseudomonadota bacterium]